MLDQLLSSADFLSVAVRQGHLHRLLLDLDVLSFQTPLSISVYRCVGVLAQYGRRQMWPRILLEQRKLQNSMQYCD